MKYLHPFPARMAPEILDDILEAASPSAVILDPMTGSGTVLGKALQSGRNAIGVDVDPLAILLSRAVASAADPEPALADGAAVLRAARVSTATIDHVPWISACEETRRFVDYWFATQQRDALARLALALRDHRFKSAQSRRLNQISLSRIIITKHAGASLAWDVSHSRPHKVREQNDFEVLDGFASALRAVVRIAQANRPERSGRVLVGDARSVHRVIRCTVDHIVTSPPYLNAIDYMRGHKFSLVWLGYSIPVLRDIRRNAIGAERSSENATLAQRLLMGVKEDFPELANLPSAQAGHLARYVADLTKLLSAFSKVVKPTGRLTTVIGNSTVRGVYVPNSSIAAKVAQATGFKPVSEHSRRIDPTRRYLPESAGSPLALRMREEVVHTFEAA